MKALVIAVKGIKEMYRDRQTFVFALLFPIVIMLVFKFVMGGDEGAETYTIAVVDLDTGEGPWDTTPPPWMQYVDPNSTASEFFQSDILQGEPSAGTFFVKEVLEKARYKESREAVFDVKVYKDTEKAEKAVTNQEVVAMLVIPANFTEALQGTVDKAIVDEVRAHGETLNYTLPDYADALLVISGELTSFSFSFASSQADVHLQGYTHALYTEVRANVGAQFPGGPVSEAGGTVTGTFVEVKATEEITMFDTMVPGVMIFGLMMQAIGVTLTLGNEQKNRTLHRLRITKMTAFDLLAGTTIRWMLLGTLQIVIFFLVAMALKVNMAGDPLVTVPVAIVISMVVVLATLSLGLIIAAYVDDPEQATNVSVMVIMPMAFFTGAFAPVEFAFARILPWTQGTNALKKAMLYADVGDAMTHTAYCLVGALVLFVIGVIAYSRHRLRN